VQLGRIILGTVRPPHTLPPNMHSAVQQSIELVTTATEAANAAIDAELLAAELALLMVKGSRHPEYSRSAVKKRLELITRLLATLQRARNVASGELVQRGCCVLWNACRFVCTKSLRSRPAAWAPPRGCRSHTVTRLQLAQAS
jgi:hypothetical protein